MVDHSVPIFPQTNKTKSILKKKHTSEANNKRRFSPPDKPLIRPASPIFVFSAFFKFNYQTNISNHQSHSQLYIYILTKSSISSTRLRRSSFVTSRFNLNIA
jgi:hypothetical protein